MSLATMFVLILAVLSLMFGLLVLSRNSKSPVNRSFFGICIMATLWPIAFEAIFIFDSIQLVRLFNSLAFLFGFLLMLSVVIFSYYFPVRRSKKSLRIVLPLGLVISVLSLTPLVTGSVQNPNGEFVFTNGSLSWLYSVAMLAGVAIVLLNIFWKHKSSSDEERTQKKLLAIGFGTSLTVGLLLAVVLPLLVETPTTSIFDVLAPFSLIFFLVPTGLAVARYKLFEFRLVLARAFAYSMVLGTLALGYFVAGITLTNVLVDDAGQQDVRIKYIYFVIAVVFAIAYGPLKRLFDRLSNKIFFRDTYDTQALLDELNQILVSTIDIQALLTKTSEILRSYLKADFATFALRQGEEDDLRFFASDNFSKQTDISSHRPLLLDHGHKVIVTNLLDNEQQELKKFLFNEHIDVLARLTADPQVEGVGYLLIGEKKSGNPYTSQDIGVVDIVGNELVIAIQNAMQFEEIQRFNVTLQEKIDVATRQLKKSNEKLKALDETKDEFISMASHQLRTPLTSVKGYLSMVLEGDAGKINENQRKLLGQAFISSQRMVFLIADLLNVSRLKTGKFIIEPLPTNLADVVESEVEQLQETAASRELTLSFNKPDNFPQLMLDETKTRQVVMNFMDNAVHYTPAGGHIKVFLEDKGSTIEYRVEDDGIGVPKSEQHHLFTKFYRANNAQKARPDGTGLGLFMAKKVIVAQNGSIIFKSQKDKGSTFGFSFSKDKLPALPAQSTTE